MRLVFSAIFLFCSTISASAQHLTVDTVSINIDPQGTDSYRLQGRFTGLSLDGATSISLALGQFAARIPLAEFARQPGANQLTYQDTSGLTPYWVSSLSLDMDALSFTAQASGIVLAGLPNPFALRLGTDTSAGCVMTRLAETSPGSFSSTGADSASTPCQLAGTPATDRTRILSDTPSTITFSARVLPTDSTDAMLLQVFRSDTSAQPVGEPLCTLVANDAGSPTCSADFNESTAGEIPLIVQGTLGAQTILSSGFSIQVVVAQGDSSVSQQVLDIQSAMAEAAAGFGEFGDSVHARVAAMQSLRKLFNRPPGLTGQPVTLTADGLSIDVSSDSGRSVTLVLNDLGSVALDDAGDPLPQSGSKVRPVRQSLPHVAPVANPYLAPRADSNLQCGQYNRTIVKNNRVLLWDTFRLTYPEADVGSSLIAPFKSSGCPHFDINLVLGERADVASLATFPEYGTIIMNTHGGTDGRNRFFFLTGQSILGQETITKGTLEDTGIGCLVLNLPEPTFTSSVPTFKPTFSGCFVTVYSSHPVLQALSNTVVWGGFCYSAYATLPTYPFITVKSPWEGIWAPDGSGTAFFGYDGAVQNYFQARSENAVFNSFLKRYSNSYDAGAAETAAVTTRDPYFAPLYEQAKRTSHTSAILQSR